MAYLRSKLHLYWKLTKSLQTGLLLVTGVSGYMSARCPVFNFPILAAVSASLFLAISGSTVLNMWFDRDIDACMERTGSRPLASRQVSPTEALLLGLALSIAGVAWAFWLDPLYGLVVSAGLFFDVLVYTLWLKRRTCWSIVWGGVAGGMPILAGRALALGRIDWIGLALALGILFWIPTHIMTFNMRYFKDYQSAGIPTFPSVYGFPFTRAAVALSSIVAALVMILAGYGLGLHWGYLRLLAVLSGGLLLLAVSNLLRPSERKNLSLFKYASAYMLGSMLLMVI